MKSQSIACAVAVWAFAVIGTFALSQEQPPAPKSVPVNYSLDLRARHPEIIRNGEFTSWVGVTNVGPWYESPAADARQKVTIENTEGTRVWAALVTMGADPSVVRSARIDLAAVGVTRNRALSLTNDQLQPATRPSAKPIVDFLPDGEWKLNWEIQILKDSAIERYRIRDFAKPSLEKVDVGNAGRGGRGGNADAAAPSARAAMLSAPPMTAPPMTAPPKRAPSVDADAIAENELHHLGAFKNEAVKWTANTKSVVEAASRIFENMIRTYGYDPYTPGIRELTWSDELTLRNHRSGVCDELAVVAITYLRSLGIRARLKIIAWNQPGEGNKVHEALEFQDEKLVWHHMDPTWKVFDDPGVYRRFGATHVIVFDADFPSDARSSADSFKYPDPVGDGMLNPFDDFFLWPTNGSARAGYSDASEVTAPAAPRP